MKLKVLAVSSTLGLLLVAAACSKQSTPAQPTQTAVDATASSDSGASATHAIGGATLTAPRLATPADGAQFPFASQPITLAVTNAVSTKSTPLTYTFEVATDSGFASKVYSKSGVAEGTSQTSLTIDKLKGGVTYFWRSRVTSDTVDGPNATPRTFVVGPEVVIQAPVLGDPAANSSVPESPTLNVNRVQRTGPAGQIVYRFQISEQSSFSSLTYNVTANERGDLSYTPHTVTIKLTVNKTYFWRVQASDPASGVTGPFSQVLSFKVSQGLDLNNVIYVQGPNIANWPQTSEITSYDISPGILCIYHTMLGLWPRTDFPFGGADLEGNQFVFGKVDGQWYGGSADWYKPGQACKGVDVSEVFIDSFTLTDNPLGHYRPQSGDVIGLAVTTPSRFWPTAATLDERSNVVLVTVP